jgi:F-type H+-transporting ATPase subunit gamma
MASLKDIRGRIGSTENTKKITQAMKLVSAAKLRKAQHTIVNMRPYAMKLLAVISDIAATHRIEHPLLSESSNPKAILCVVLTSDRGLCGGFNGNINKFAERYYHDHFSEFEKFDFLFIGRRGADYFKSRSVNTVDRITHLDRNISYPMALEVAERLMKTYTSGEYDEIRLIYNEFKSAIEQKVVCEKLLPIDIEAYTQFNSEEAKGFSRDMIFEPSPRDIIDELIEKHFGIQVYRCMSESVAAEHGARMTSMENATKNAGELIRSLKLTYNKLRQASITTELIEITSGAEALKG